MGALESAGWSRNPIYLVYLRMLRGLRYSTDNFASTRHIKRCIDNTIFERSFLLATLLQKRCHELQGLVGSLPGHLSGEDNLWNALCIEPEMAKTSRLHHRAVRHSPTCRASATAAAAASVALCESASDAASSSAAASQTLTLPFFSSCGGVCSRLCVESKRLRVAAMILPVFPSALAAAASIASAMCVATVAICISTA